MRCPNYGTCKMVNLCKSHCVRKSMEEDGWILDDAGQFQQKPKDETCQTKTQP